jgi:hypothetical protein
MGRDKQIRLNEKDLEAASAFNAASWMVDLSQAANSDDERAEAEEKRLDAIKKREEEEWRKPRIDFSLAPFVLRARKGVSGTQGTPAPSLMSRFPLSPRCISSSRRKSYPPVNRAGASDNTTTDLPPWTMPGDVSDAIWSPRFRSSNRKTLTTSQAYQREQQHQQQHLDDGKTESHETFAHPVPGAIAANRPVSSWHPWRRGDTVASLGFGVHGGRNASAAARSRVGSAHHHYISSTGNIGIGDGSDSEIVMQCSVGVGPSGMGISDLVMKGAPRPVTKGGYCRMQSGSRNVGSSVGEGGRRTQPRVAVAPSVRRYGTY